MPTTMHRNLRTLILSAVMIVSVFGVGLRAAHAQDAGPAIFTNIGINSPDKVNELINAGDYIQAEPRDYAWIYTGWTIIRQMSNILVLVFLFIASAATTLNLQIGTYGIKRMLPTIITGTILANMSREITSIFLSVQHALSSGFISMAGGNTANGLWGNLSAPVRTALQTVQPTSTISGVVGGIIYLILATVGTIALLLLLLLFWVRKIILGFLIILAPLAFLSMAAPFSQGMFRKWWSEYIKWMFMPAISAFFISVGGIIVASVMSAGAFSFIAFLAALLSIYLAIKTPFMMGGLVGAAAGFIAGNTWGRMKTPLAENAKILAHRTPVLGTSIRALSAMSNRRRNTLKALESGPVKRMHTARSLPANAGALPRLWHNVASFTANIDNFFGRRINRNQIRADNLVTTQEAEQKAALGRAEADLLENDQGYKARIGALTESEASVTKMLEGLKNEAGAAALSTNELVRRERELARQRSSAGEGLKKIAERRLALEGEDANTDVGQYVQGRLERMARENNFITANGRLGARGLREPVGDVGAMLSTVGDQARDLEEVINSETKKKQVGRSRRMLRNHTRADNYSRREDVDLLTEMQGMSASDWNEMGGQLIDALVQDGSLTQNDAIRLRAATRDGATGAAERRDIIRRYTATGAHSGNAVLSRGRDNRGAFFKRAQKAVGEANQVNIDLSSKNLDREQREGMIDAAFGGVRVTGVNAAGEDRRQLVLHRLFNGQTHYDGTVQDRFDRSISATDWDKLVGDVLPHAQALHSNIVNGRPSAASDITELIDNFLTPVVAAGGAPGINQDFINRATEIATALAENNPAACGAATMADVRSAAKTHFGSNEVQRTLGARGEVAKIMAGEDLGPAPARPMPAPRRSRVRLPARPQPPAGGTGALPPMHFPGVDDGLGDGGEEGDDSGGDDLF